jgi:hypothetical protein
VLRTCEFTTQLCVGEGRTVQPGLALPVGMTGLVQRLGECGTIRFESVAAWGPLRQRFALIAHVVSTLKAAINSHALPF